MGVYAGWKQQTSKKRSYSQGFRRAGSPLEGYFFQSVIADCVERNHERTGKACVPDKAIVCTSNKLEMPSYREGFDRLYFVRIEQGEFDPVKGQEVLALRNRLETELELKTGEEYREWVLSLVCHLEEEAAKVYLKEIK